MKKLYLVVFSLLLTGSVTFGQNPLLVRDYFDSDGVINAIAADSVNHVAYIGGTFTYFTGRTPFGAKVDTTTGYSDVCYAKPNNIVRVALSDGNGGWYIGGNFTMVGDSVRNCLAHLDASGKVLPWNPNVNGSVAAMAFNGPILYIGGSFTSVGAQTRNRIAAINKTSGLATSWDPNSDGSISAILVDSVSVYVGGSFSNIGLMARSKLAALDTTYGIATGWNPSPNYSVYTIAISGQYLWVGGQFYLMGTDSRPHIAKIDKISGVTYYVHDFSATLSSGNVNSIAISGDAAFIAGSLCVNPTSCTLKNFCVISVTTNNISTWGSSPYSPILYKVVQKDNKVYIGGSFNDYFANHLNRSIIRFDVHNSGSVADSWNPCADKYSSVGNVYAIAPDASSVYVGGDYATIGRHIQKNFCAINSLTGKIDSTWSDKVADCAITIQGDKIFVSGYKVSTGFYYVSALDRNTHAVLWQVYTSNKVNALAASGSKLYVGGNFTTIGTQSRNYLAALDVNTGSVTTWNPSPNDYVNSLLISGGTLYTGGAFILIGGQLRNRIAALDTTTGLATTWNPNANGAVKTIMKSGATIYAGGVFTTIGGTTRNRIATIDITTGLASAWDPNANDTVKAITKVGSTVYVGGTFTTIGGQTRNRIAAIDATTALATNWDPNADAAVNTLCYLDNILYVGGAFTTISGSTRWKYVTYKLCSTFAPTITLNMSTLHSSPANSYQWYDQNGAITGATSQDYITTANGDYYVITNMNGCTSDSSNVISVLTTNIVNYKPIEAIVIHPNPANDILFIDGLSNTAKAEIFDISGKLILIKQFNSNQIDISPLAKGLYFIKLSTAEGSVVRKFVKE
jgi:trimeric autotransporter adhesin